MVSARLYGSVTWMAGLVASAGVTMDERIRNLTRERGHQHLFLTVDDPELEPKLLKIMETLVAEAESVREGIGQTVVRNLKVIARMGTFLEDVVPRTYPEFPLRSGIFSWEEYLPPLGKNLIQLAERYDSAPAALAAFRLFFKPNFLETIFPHPQPAEHPLLLLQIPCAPSVRLSARTFTAPTQLFT